MRWDGRFSPSLTGPQRAAALGSIIGRMAAPCSELSTYGWLGERSGLGELLGVDFEAMWLSALYRISDRLLASKAALEQTLFGCSGQAVADTFLSGNRHVLFPGCDVPQG